MSKIIKYKIVSCESKPELNGLIIEVMQITSQNKNKVNNGAKKKSKFDLILERFDTLEIRVEAIDIKLNNLSDKVDKIVELNNLKTR